MGARLIILEREEYKQLRDLLTNAGAGNGAVVVRKDVADDIDRDVLRDRAFDYDFGGDPDCVVDFVDRPDHYFISGEDMEFDKIVEECANDRKGG